MPEPPGQNNFRSPYPSGQLAQRPDQPLHGQQPLGINYPNAGINTGTNNNQPSGTLPPVNRVFTSPIVASRAKKRRLIHRVRHRYERLSSPGKIISIVLVIAILLPSFWII